MDVDASHSKFIAFELYISNNVDDVPEVDCNGITFVSQLDRFDIS